MRRSAKSDGTITGSEHSSRTNRLFNPASFPISRGPGDLSHGFAFVSGGAVDWDAIVPKFDRSIASCSAMTAAALSPSNSDVKN